LADTRILAKPMAANLADVCSYSPHTPMSDSGNKPREERWREEARFFDEWADRAFSDARPIDPLALARYGSPHVRRRFNKEFRFRILGKLPGKRVLDIGCGDGTNAILLASLGAQVTGIDVSPKAVELAAKRAELSGVSASTRFVCAPLETADLPAASFDVIWGDAILHHLLAELDRVLPRLVAWAKPDGLLLFSEPVNFNPTLRRLRFMVPVKTEATPDERPLEPREIDLLSKYIADIRVEPFAMLGRLNRFVLSNYNYERASRPRQAISNMLAAVDYAILRTPGFRSLAGTAVLYGHPRHRSNA
jgi:2-polyprenyl-3-methyl-5-hydroxy-6-metoxy-1,4-benzoquinol methylase